MREYETLRAGGYKLEKLSVVDELATVLSQGADRAGAESKGPGGGGSESRSSRSSATRRPTTQLRALLNQRGGECVVGRRTNAPLVGREGRLLEERGEPAELECCDGII